MLLLSLFSLLHHALRLQHYFFLLRFALGGAAEYLVAAIVYTIISFVVAYITKLIQNRNCCENNNCNTERNNNYNLNNTFSSFNPNSFNFNNEITPNTFSETDNTAITTNSTNYNCRRYR